MTFLMRPAPSASQARRRARSAALDPSPTQQVNLNALIRGIDVFYLRSHWPTAELINADFNAINLLGNLCLMLWGCAKRKRMPEVFNKPGRFQANSRLPVRERGERLCHPSWSRWYTRLGGYSTVTRDDLKANGSYK